MISNFKPYIQPRLVSLYLDTMDQVEISIKTGDTVFIGTPLTHNGPLPFSTVSGKVKQITKSIDPFGKDTYTCLIQNDFKNNPEPYFRKKDIKDIITTYFSPMHPLESFHFIAKIPLVVNLLFVNEPFVSLDLKYAQDDYEKVLHTLQILHELWDFEQIVVMIPEDGPSALFSESNMPITVKKIKPEKQADYAYLTVNQVFSDALVKQKPYRYLLMESLLKLHDMIQNHRPPTITRLVVSGAGISQPTVLNVRIGTIMEDLKRIFFGYTTDNTMTLHLNALFGNQTLKHDDFSITHKMFSLHAQEHREAEVYECIACGRCNTHCPVGILPSKIMHSFEHGIVLEHMKSTLCIDCGLCAYYCPSKINVMDFVQRAKKRLKGGDR